MKNLITIVMVLMITPAIAQTYTTYDAQGRIKQRTTMQGDNGSTYSGSGEYLGGVRKEQSGYATTNSQGHISTRTVQNGSMFYTYDGSGKLLTYGTKPPNK